MGTGFALNNVPVRKRVMRLAQPAQASQLRGRL